MNQLKLFILFPVALITLIMPGNPAMGQHPLKNITDAVEISYVSSQPVIGYTLRVAETDLSAYEVEMSIRNVPDTFRVAMMAHPEYDDRFWRYVKDIRVETKNGKGNVFREDSALWRIVAGGDEIVLKYNIHLPTPVEGLRAAWRPFLSSSGGLVGGPQSFMYVVGSSLVSSPISLKIPKGWMIATGLEATDDPTTFYAASAAILVDAPILIGYFKTWQFTVDQVPHKVCYWPLPNAVSFDTTTLIKYIKRYIRQCDTLFGRLPYSEYTFLLLDGAYGALEHCNSVTIGWPGAQIAKDITSYFGTIAHEYFHTWNLMRIRPIEFGDIGYQTPPLSRGLWWSEGLTMYYADLLLRRAELPAYDSTRIKHFESLLSSYFSSTGNMHISPEKVSLASDGPPGMLGDYSASTHLQGELLGAMLDIIIRDATNGKSSIDDVMRMMMNRYSGPKGFSNNNIEEITTAICRCNVHPFFRDHIFGNQPIDFNKFLLMAGMRFDSVWIMATDASGKPVPDLQVYAFQLPGSIVVNLGITDPFNCWGRAGLHTEDVILSVNKSGIKTAFEFRQIVRRLQIKDTVLIEVQRPTGIFRFKVIVTGYLQPVIHIEKLNTVSKKQLNLRRKWLLAL